MAIVHPQPRLSPATRSIIYLPQIRWLKTKNVPSILIGWSHKPLTESPHLFEMKSPRCYSVFQNHFDTRRTFLAFMPEPYKPLVARERQMEISSRKKRQFSVESQSIRKCGPMHLHQFTSWKKNVAVTAQCRWRHTHIHTEPLTQPQTLTPRRHIDTPAHLARIHQRQIQAIVCSRRYQFGYS